MLRELFGLKKKGITALRNGRGMPSLVPNRRYLEWEICAAASDAEDPKVIEGRLEECPDPRTRSGREDLTAFRREIILLLGFHFNLRVTRVVGESSFYDQLVALLARHVKFHRFVPERIHHYDSSRPTPRVPPEVKRRRRTRTAGTLEELASEPQPRVSRADRKAKERQQLAGPGKAGAKIRSGRIYEFSSSDDAAVRALLRDAEETDTYSLQTGWLVDDVDLSDLDFDDCLSFIEDLASTLFAEVGLYVFDIFDQIVDPDAFCADLGRFIGRATDVEQFIPVGTHELR